MDDPKINWLLVKLLGRNVSSVASKIAADREINQKACDEILAILQTKVNECCGPTVDKKILVLFQTKAYDLRLSVILYPFAMEVHKQLLALEEVRLDNFPKPISIYMIILFYKCWLLMTTVEADRRELRNMAKQVLIRLKNDTTAEERQRCYRFLEIGNARLTAAINKHTPPMYVFSRKCQLPLWNQSHNCVCFLFLFSESFSKLIWTL